MLAGASAQVNKGFLKTLLQLFVRHAKGLESKARWQLLTNSTHACWQNSAPKYVE